MAFDYVADFRTRPVIRVDSWIGAETSGSTFAADLVVAAGATLTITAGTTLRFAPGTGIRVYGALHVEGADGARVVLTARTPSAAWSGVSFAAGSSGRLRHADVTRVGGKASGREAVRADGAPPLVEDAYLEVVDP
jgi:hypothetical protein